MLVILDLLLQMLLVRGRYVKLILSLSFLHV